MAVRVPEAAKKSLAQAMALGATTYSSLLEAMRSAPTFLLVDDLARDVGTKANLPEAQTKEVVTLLANLYRVRELSGLSAEAFSDEVVQGAKTAGVPDAEATDIGAFKAFLVEALQLDQPLGVTSKVLDVMVQHDRVYCAARVLTDIRPVFGADINDGPQAAVLVHTLKLTYHDGPEMRDVFFAMDRSDIEGLRGALERAMKKEQTLRDFANRANLRLVDKE